MQYRIKCDWSDDPGDMPAILHEARNDVDALAWLYRYVASLPDLRKLATVTLERDDPHPPGFMRVVISGPFTRPAIH